MSRAKVAGLMIAMLLLGVFVGLRRPGASLGRKTSAGASAVHRRGISVGPHLGAASGVSAPLTYCGGPLLASPEVLILFWEQGALAIMVGSSAERASLHVAENGMNRAKYQF
jgi:hypothetical protein